MGETPCGVGDLLSPLRLSGLTPLGDRDLCGEALLRGVGLRRAGEAL